MDQHVVAIPQVDVRQVFGDDLLKLRVDLFSLLLIDCAAALVDECVNFRI
jgi:hypothetical protein